MFDHILTDNLRIAHHAKPMVWTATSDGVRSYTGTAPDVMKQSVAATAADDSLGWVCPGDLANTQGMRAQSAAQHRSEQVYGLRGHEEQQLLEVVVPWTLNGKQLGITGYCWPLTRDPVTYEELLEHRALNNSLLEWSQRLQSVTGFPQLMEMVLEQIEQKLNYQSASFFLHVEENPHVYAMISSSGVSAEEIADTIPPLPVHGDSMIEEIMRGLCPTLIENGRVDPRTNKDIVQHLGLWSIVNVNMTISGRHIGSLATGTYHEAGPKLPSYGELLALQTIASHIAPVIERIRFAEKEARYQSELIRARNTAEQANQAKTEFLSRMSHELRTPLNAILGFSQLLQADTGLAETQQDSVSEIRHAGQHLLHLVDDILDLARIHAGKLHVACESCDVSNLVHNVLSLVSGQATAKELCINNRIDNRVPPVLADPLRLKQAIINLLSNAIKYNRRRGAISVSIAPGDDGYLLLQVEDTGDGIAPENIEKLFQPFERIQNPACATSGAGIGLVITRYLMNLMGGDVGVRSTPGQGSCFWLNIPLAPGSASVTGVAPA